MQRALELGINLLDTSHDYNGSEQRYAEVLTPMRNELILSTKFDARDVSGMMREVEGSLSRLKTDYIDILFIHTVSGNDSVSAIERGIYKHMVKLKDSGTVRFIGFSSMNSAVRSRDLIRELDFDVVLLALNATTYGDFARVALPAAREKNTGVLAMKVMRDVVGVGATAKELLDYALDLDGVGSAVIGHYGLNVLEENAELAKAYHPLLVPVSRSELERRLRPLAGPHALCWARPEYVDRSLA